MIDDTVKPEFISENADRLLAWDWVHGTYCAGKAVWPSRIAHRVGLTTEQIHGIIAGALDRHRASVAHEYDIIKNGR